MSSRGMFDTFSTTSVEFDSCVFCEAKVAVVGAVGVLETGAVGVSVLCDFSAAVGVPRVGDFLGATGVFDLGDAVDDCTGRLVFRT